MRPCGSSSRPIFNPDRPDPSTPACTGGLTCLCTTCGLGVDGPRIPVHHGISLRITLCTPEIALDRRRRLSHSAPHAGRRSRPGPDDWYRRTGTGGNAGQGETECQPGSGRPARPAQGGSASLTERQATGTGQGKRGRQRALTLPSAVTSCRLLGQPGGKADGGPLAGVAPGGAGICRQPPGHSSLSARCGATGGRCDQTACSSQAAYLGSRPRTAAA